MDPASDRVIRFLENLTLVGDYSSVPLRLRDWQRDPIVKLLGSNQYRKCLWALPRSQGKTTIAAAILIYSLLGTGKHGQELYSCAASQSQAAIIFKYASQMLRADPKLMELGQVIIHEHTKRIVSERYNNVYVALSADSATAHGLKPSLVLCDECHAWRSNELLEVMMSGFGARTDHLTIILSTAGNDKHHWFFGEWDYGCKVRDKIISNDQYLPVIYAANPEDPWDSEETWHKAMPALGDYCSLEFIREEAKVAKDFPTKLDAFKRFYLNVWTSGSNQWISNDAWQQCQEDFTAEDMAGMSCACGVDLSSTIDLSSATLVFPMEDGKYRILPYTFCPEEGAIERERRDHVPYRQWIKAGDMEATPGNSVDYDYIRRRVNELGKQFRITSIYIDRWNATQLAQQLEGDGFKIEKFGQGYASMNHPCKLFEALVADKKIAHNGNKALDFCVTNMILDQDAAGNYKTSKAKSIDRIDTAQAMLMGLAGASEFTVNACTLFFGDRQNFIL